ncbi:MAG: hypothetical protein Q8N48_03955 [Thiobacillus sp.]|nr:hypothetical protein [Thiobacillus sp.]MDP2254078.1 hypothetical protein [Thiobacillus sp.]MDP2977962.1 hypothetical protein [Thiobacillus sp.]
MNNQMEADVIQDLITLIMRSDTPFEKTMDMLGALEPSIEAAYALGQTQVKPVCLMTADDLVS